MKVKNEKLFNAVSPKLATPNDLSQRGRRMIASAVNGLVADSFALFIKTKNYHWHMSGSHYRDYHLLLDEQATQIFAMIDVLAERVRKLGENTIHSVSQVSQLQSIKDDNEEFVIPKKMIIRLMEDNISFASRMREAHALCDEHNDVATASFLEVFIDETERRSWFLFETQAD